MGDCYLTMHGTGKRPPSISSASTAAYTLVDEGKGNWHIIVTGSGSITFNALGTGKNGFEVFACGGGGAGSANGGPGGGGYTAIASATIAANTAYAVTVGSGGQTDGASGSQTKGFGVTANGGTGGGKNTVAMSYKITQTSGNVYQYKSLDSNTNTSYGPETRQNLAYPPRTVTHHLNGRSLYEGYKNGYWLGWPSDPQGGVFEPVTGTGGSATTPFGLGVSYSGTGSSANHSNAGNNTGKGGGGDQSASFGKGGSGIIIFRNKR